VAGDHSALVPMAAVVAPLLDEQMERGALADDQLELEALPVIRNDADQQMELLADDRLIEQPEATMNDQMESLDNGHYVGVEGLMEPRHGNHLDAIVEVQVDYLSIANNVSRFKKCYVVTRQHLDRKVRSNFAMQTTNQVYQFQLAPLEVYSAGLLGENVHGRDVFPISRMNPTPSNSVVISIPGVIPEWMDPSDNLHVVCKESIIFRSHQFGTTQHRSLL
jgi:hypothetical protein